MHNDSFVTTVYSFKIRTPISYLLDSNILFATMANRSSSSTSIAFFSESSCCPFSFSICSLAEDFGSGVEFFRGFCTLPVLSRPPMFPNFWLFPPFVQEQPSSHQRLCSERLPCSSISSWLQLRVWSEFFFHPLILCCLSAFVMQKVKFRRWVYLFYCASKITAEKADEHRNLLEYEQCHQNSD